MEIQLPYGLKNGILTHISDVESGLACGALCPACNAPLVARKGKIKQHHFAHAADTDCTTATETALHLAAKEILARRKEIVLPEMRIPSDLRYQPEWGIGSDHHPSGQLLLVEERRYAIKEAQVEYRMSDMIPDLLLNIEGRPLIVEIKVTHAVDALKARKIQQSEISAIEIDLSNHRRDFQLNELEPLIIDSVDNKKWIHNVIAYRKAMERREVLRQAEEARKLKYAEMMERRRIMAEAAGVRLPIITRRAGEHVGGCPVTLKSWECADGVNRPYAKLNDCNECEYHANIENGRVLCTARHPDVRKEWRGTAWLRSDGSSVPINKMDTNHIISILRMLVEYGLEKGKSNWIDAMIEELTDRKIKFNFGHTPAEIFIE